MATTEQIQSVADLHTGANEDLLGYDKTIGQYAIAHPDPYELAAALTAGAVIVKTFGASVVDSVLDVTAGVGAEVEQLVVAILFSDATTSTDASTVTWVSSNVSHATVDAAGLVTGILAGQTVTIAGTIGSKTATVTFTTV